MGRCTLARCFVLVALLGAMLVGCVMPCSGDALMYLVAMLMCLVAALVCPVAALMCLVAMLVCPVAALMYPAAALVMYLVDRTA